MIAFHERALASLLISVFVAASLPACSSTEEVPETIQARTDEGGAPSDECDPDASDFADTDCIFDAMEND